MRSLFLLRGKYNFVMWSINKVYIRGLKLTFNSEMADGLRKPPFFHKLEVENLLLTSIALHPPPPSPLHTQTHPKKIALTYMLGETFQGSCSSLLSLSIVWIFHFVQTHSRRRPGEPRTVYRILSKKHDESY